MHQLTLRRLDAKMASEPAAIPFYSFSREFDLRYIFADWLVLLVYVSWIWRQGWRLPLLRGLAIGAICYYIDAVVWYNTTLEDGRFQRTWTFECRDGVVLERPSLVDVGREATSCELLGYPVHPTVAYLILKYAADFMMTVSYSLIWFTWESIVMVLWIKGEGRQDSIARHSLVAFVLHFAVYPLSLLLPAGGDVRAVGTRHMHDSERGWMRYAIITNCLLIVYNIAWKRRSVSRALQDNIFCWTMGCFQAFGMVAPLYLFRIRPVFEASRFLYEVAFLFNRGSAEHYLIVLYVTDKTNKRNKAKKD